MKPYRGADPEFCTEIKTTGGRSLISKRSSLSVGRSRSKSPTLPSISNTDLKEKCSKCGKRNRKGNCSQSACLACCTDEGCDGHRETREMTKKNDSILDGTNWINKLASEKRALAIPPGVFHETSFHYLDETVYLWDLKEFFANPKWRDDAIRRSKRNKELRQQTTTQTIIGKAITNTKSPSKQQQQQQQTNRKRKSADSNLNSCKFNTNLNEDMICSNKGSNRNTIALKGNRRQRFKLIMDTLYDQSLQNTQKK